MARTMPVTTWTTRRNSVALPSVWGRPVSSGTVRLRNPRTAAPRDAREATPARASPRSGASPVERPHVEHAALRLGLVVVQRPRRGPADDGAVDVELAVVARADEPARGRVPVVGASEVRAVIVEDHEAPPGALHDPDLHLRGDVHPSLLRWVNVMPESGLGPEAGDRADRDPLGLFAGAEGRGEERPDHRDADERPDRAGERPKQADEESAPTVGGAGGRGRFGHLAGLATCSSSAAPAAWGAADRRRRHAASSRGIDCRR